jgi:hypothetical protein
MRQTIVTGHIFDSLWKALQADPNAVARTEAGQFAWAARPCKIWAGVWPNRHLVNSGGLELRVRVCGQYGHASIFTGRTITSRLKPGWGETQLRRRVGHLDVKVREHQNLMRHRESVYLKAERCEKTDAFHAAVEAEEERLGKTSDYSEMTREECGHWLRWLDQYAPPLPPREAPKCPHGDDPAACDACYRLSDHAYDAAREAR